jgi:glyceraldehyde-3-phosphate dehydrogenase type I
MAEKINFGINGFGRIGRTALRVWWSRNRDASELKLINTSGSMELEGWVQLLKYDSNYGRFADAVSFETHQTTDQVSDQDPVLGTITISSQQGESHTITLTAQRDPKKIPWGAHGVQVVIESTGVFIDEESASQHFAGGASSVLISAPDKGGNVSTSVLGVNEFDRSAKVFSNASCTTNCLAPVVQIMHQSFGIKKSMMTTIHSYTDDQNTQDNSHKDLRRARSAAENIIPTTTGAKKAISSVIPELTGLMDGLALRVPTPVGSLCDMVFVVGRPTTVEEVNQAFIDAAAQPRWQGILATTTDPIVSSDIVGRSESSIVDLSLTSVVEGDLVKVVSWYDNEWGYCCRLIEQVAHLG